MDDETYAKLLSLALSPYTDLDNLIRELLGLANEASKTLAKIHSDQKPM